ncbi:2-succinyl-6-hydroxy-2,4-cyclohexadiene-1-carboxylate synthase [bioreactor metagenome]|uniref:2-succinyl-6-hydroxy-2, 4-cyclohexadiene-1-carboxylate synthase n=1 Tax=bioreactor metagenome TaxID=1076179 RepID=A0A644T823_9ZZZZ|nr:alpha/beta hydrolase [Methanobrevibacter sp.]MEA4957479.1 alpha/beta hydrolase [Methanobrevibacter sp.]
MENSNIMYYDEEGTSNDEIIIFIHSNLLSNWIWINQRDYFRDFHCIYLDLPNHGKSHFDNEFSIEKSTELIKSLIQEKSLGLSNDTNSNRKTKKVNLVGISLGGQIALDLLAKYPELIDKVVVSGVNLYENPEENDFHEVISMMDLLKINILDKKPEKFLIKALLAEYGIKKDYAPFIKESYAKISKKDLNSITKESLKFTIPNDIGSFNKKGFNKDNKSEIKYNNISEISKNSNKNNNINNNNLNNNNNNFEISNNNEYENLLILYGTKEYPRVKTSARLIKDVFNQAEIFGVYRSIHLWNIIDYEWFNEIVKDFLCNKKNDLKNKDYLIGFKDE